MKKLNLKIRVARKQKTRAQTAPQFVVKRLREPRGDGKDASVVYFKQGRAVKKVYFSSRVAKTKFDPGSDFYKAVAAAGCFEEAAELKRPKRRTKSGGK